MSEIRKWLESIGLGQYADAFEANDIEMDLLKQVDDQMLRDIGVASAGHRLRIRNAIAKLAPAPATEANLSATAPAHDTPSAERRQLTVMFCDLVGSTALSVRLDPEDLRGIMTAYHRRCTELVERNGGFVAKYMGDGVLAYFGYPQAHEHDAERAVRAGLNLVETVPKLATHAGAPLQVRVGIATGLVVVGELIGAGVAQEQAVVGETPNLAARLQALAEPGAVVIASSTRQLIGGLFEYRDLGAVALKGFAENIPAWQVLGAGAAESRFEALRATTTPLVGRDEEIDLLMRRWEQAKRGDGCVVLISGEPGIGKSRIAQTVVERLGPESHIRLRYFCSPHHQDSALYPSITQLERAAGFRRDDTDEQRLNKLEKVLAQGTNDLSEAVPLLADLLSIPTGDRYPPLNLTPQKRKEKTLHAQLAQVEGLAAQQPVLMVWEDVHWSDPTTRESLDLLIDRVATLRVLVIITFRPELTPPWIGRPHVTMLNLNRLPPRQRAEMIVHVSGGRALPKEIAEQIVNRTDGVPLFIEELTKSVIESGVVTESGDHYTAIDPVAPLAIPTSLHASLLARLDRLAPIREVAQIGAALGRQFSHELISAVAGMPQQQLDHALEQLVTAELIFRRGIPPDAEYTFKHALVQDAAYSTLLKARRQQIHSKIVVTLEQKFPDVVAAQLPLLAQHSTDAGLTKKAVGYWLKAGQQSASRSAMAEAAIQFEKGLEVLCRLPEGNDRREHELDLRVGLGPALIATKGWSAHKLDENYARASTLAEQVGRSDYLIPLQYGQWAFRLVRAEHKLALAHAGQIEQIGIARSDSAARWLGRYTNAATHLWLGEFITAGAAFEECCENRDPAHRSQFLALTGADQQAVMLFQFAAALSYLGYFDRARERMNEALAVARQLRQAHTLAWVLTGVCWVNSINRLFQDMERNSAELIAISKEHNFELHLAYGMGHRGRWMMLFGQPQEGLALLKRGFAATRATGTVFLTASTLMRIADNYLVLGEYTEGLNCLTEAARILETSEDGLDAAYLHCLRGELLYGLADLAEAERSYSRALTVATQQGTKLYELRTATSLARLWRDQGRRAEARDLLAPIYGWFTEGFDTPVLQEAKALLDELA
jgi:class 3 adenylate cyclase/tetratricopeptide (TPR) repeat protein